MKDERDYSVTTFAWHLLASWDPLIIENCQLAYIPQQNITIDEQLLPCKARCKFTQYMAQKPDKFGLKFWMAVDNETKYLDNGIPYVGKDETRANDTSVPTNVVIKLMEPLFKRGYNVTCDNLCAWVFVF